MNRRIWALGAMAAAAAAVAVGASCTPQTECSYIDRPIGDPPNRDPLHPTEDDVAYCWQGYDSVGLFALRFERGDPDGGIPNPLFIVEPPNSLSPAGGEFQSVWDLDSEFDTPAGPVALLDVPVLGGQFQVQINTTSMLLGNPGTGASAFRRAICTGFGFETQEKACRGSPSRP
ncbi:MAG TPA: hypothetical protein VND93_27520 [Myxococcales bacterium]|nr:hypothetical protein [Myxococcales bacterium]